MARNFISFFVLCALLVVATMGGQGCANIVPPQGGVRDSLPPRLIDVRPGDSTRHFTGNRIVFSFDEYVDLDASAQTVIVSPVPKRMPLISRKLNVVSVKLNDSLEENTTYAINFGRTIKDVNEGNVLNDYTYMFSTGATLDSLEVHGKVLLAETGETDTTLTVMLHTTNEDSAVRRERPRYIAKLDNTGSFTFRYLPSDTFYIYALASQGGSYFYSSTKQLFAFSDSAVAVTKQTPPVTLYAYATTAGTTEAAKTTPSLSGRTANADKRLKVQSNLSEGRQDLQDKFVLTFETPLKNFDSSKLRLYADSMYTPVAGYSWQLDSTRRKAILSHTWTPNTSYHLVLEKDLATDSLNHQLLRTDTLDFRSRSIEDYGKLSIRFRNIDLSKNPVVLFFLSDALKYSIPLSSIALTQNMFLPGDYDLRILYDENKNGKWDPGTFFTKRKQPELVKPVQRKIVVKADWSNEFEIDVTTATGPKLPVQTQSSQQQQRPGNRRF